MWRRALARRRPPAAWGPRARLGRPQIGATTFPTAWRGLPVNSVLERRTMIRPLSTKGLDAATRRTVAAAAAAAKSEEDEVPLSPKKPDRRLIRWPKGDLEVATNRLMEQAVGSMSLSDVPLARGCLAMWARQGTWKDAQRAEALLDRLVAEADIDLPLLSRHDDDDDDDVVLPVVNAVMYNTVMNSWAKCGAPDRAESLLRRMQKRHDAAGGNDKAPAPDVACCNSLLSAWAVASDEREATRRMEELMEWMEWDPAAPRPNKRTYNILMNRHANNLGDATAGSKAEELLFRLSSKSLKETGHSLEPPDLYTFNTVLKAWLNSTGGMEGAKRADDILALMTRLAKQEGGFPDLQPDPVTYTTVIRCYADAGGMPAADRAHQLLQELLAERPSTENMDVTNCFKAVMTALARSGHADAGPRAERLLEQLVGLAAPEQDGAATRDRFYARPTVSVFVALLDAWAKSTVHGAPQKAEAWLHRLRRRETIGSLSHPLPLPNTILYNVVMNAWNRHGGPDSARRVEDLLNLMEESDDCKPDEGTFLVALETTAKSPERHASTKTLAMLRRMEASLEITSALPYSTVLLALARSRSRHCHNQALQVVEELVAASGNAALFPNPSVFYSLLQSFGKVSGEEDAARRMHRLWQLLEKGKVPLNAKFYTMLLQAWANFRSSHYSARRALEVFEQIPHEEVDAVLVRTMLLCLRCSRSEEAVRRAVEIYKWAQEERGLTLDLRCHNALLGCLAASESRKGAQRATDFLLERVRRWENQTEKEEKKNRPRDFDIASVNVCLKAWSRVLEDAPAAAATAESLVAEVQRLQPLLQPTVVTLSTALRCFAQSDEKARDRASELLEWGKQCGVVLDRGVYEDAIGCFACSTQPEKARACLDAMLESYQGGSHDLNPRTVAYNGVLRSCGLAQDSSREEKERALAILQATFQEVCADEKATDRTFADMVASCGRLATSTTQLEEELLPPVLEACRSMGLWGPLMREELQLVVSPAAREAWGPPAPEWSRNVKLWQKKPYRF